MPGYCIAKKDMSQKAENTENETSVDNNKED